LGRSFQEVRENFRVSGDSAPRSELAAIFATAICRLLERTKADFPNVLASGLGNWPAKLTCGCLLRHCDDSEP
jgi:hypothetical protein